ncbi:MAG: ATP-binding cassette domain-containing protein [Erysipelotrichaceae bacterium]|nr:ATP-binding cassette domain-containing protein [Erysipelotrichaceae bacterium]
MIKIEKLSKTYQDDQLVLDDINLTINDHEFVVIQGPSGIGKTTLIRMIAGLEPITNGRILIDNVDVIKTKPNENKIAMIFQTNALFPNLNVYENVALGLDLLMPKDMIEQKVKETLMLLEIDTLIKRKPHQLSLGQQQRVALGRAMVRDAKIFLMDEPLANLDRKLRNEMCELILMIHNKLKATTLYITHDEQEAQKLADRIVIIQQNKISAIIDNQNK